MESKKNIRKCPHCNQDMEVTLGLTKNNMKRLLRRPTLEEGITLFIMILAVGSLFIYNTEMKAIDTYIKENCTCTQDFFSPNQDSNFIINDLTNFKENGNKKSER